MKKILLTLVLAIGAVATYAQTYKEEVDMLQAMFGMEKKAMMAEFIQLEGTQKDAFWAIYDEYETKRKELGKKRIDLLDRYVSNYNAMDDVATDKLVMDMISLQGQNDKLIASYYPKVKKAAGTKTAAQFFQLEGYVLSKIRTELLENIPVIGQLEK